MDKLKTMFGKWKYIAYNIGWILICSILLVVFLKFTGITFDLTSYILGVVVMLILGAGFSYIEYKKSTENYWRK